MSYILNALRKSEQERNALKSESPLPVKHSNETNPPQRRFFRFIPLFLLVNLAALGYLFYRLPMYTDMVASNPPSASPVSRPEIPKNPSDTVKSNNLQLSPVKALNDTTSISELLDLAQKPKTQVSDIQTAENKINPPSNRETESAAPSNKSSPTQPKTDLPIEAVAVKKAAEELIKDNTLAPTPIASINPEPKIIQADSTIPWLSELGNDLQTKIPPLTINVLAFDQNPSARFVIIDMMKYKIGQRIKDSLVLKDILTNSLVLSFEGQEFRIEGP